MKTFVILLSCLACCVVARRLGATTKPRFLESIGESKQGYAYGGAQQRQQFLLDVLLQVQKPLANVELIQLGQELVTEPAMYIKHDDIILQEFLQLASSQHILGPNDAYNPVDMTHVRQLVGLQRFFVLARDFQIFQKNVVYARLYFNAVMFVDALTLAIRERPDTQDLVMPPMNEILPELYYDNYILYSARNVDFERLVDQVKGTGSRLLDYFGALYPVGKYASYNEELPERKQYGAGKEISAEIVLEVENQNDLPTELSDDIQLDIAWKSIIIDQLAQTATESIECGQRIGGGGSSVYYSEGEKYQRGGYSNIYAQGYGQRYGQSQRYEQSPRYYGYGAQDQYRGSYQGYGDKVQDFVNINELPKVSADSERLLPISNKARGHSTYVNPFYGPRNQYGFGNQEYGRSGLYDSYSPRYQYGYGSQEHSSYSPRYQYGYGSQDYGTSGSYDPSRGYSTYVNPFYGPRSEYGYGNKGYAASGSYQGSYVPYGPYPDATKYGYKGQQYGGVGQYGYNKLSYGSHYTGGPRTYEEYQGAQHSSPNKKHGSYNDYAGQKYQGLYDQGYDSAYTGPDASQYYQGDYYAPYAAKYYQGAQYDASDKRYGSNGYAGQQYRDVHDQRYGLAYTGHYAPKYHQGGQYGRYEPQQYKSADYGYKSGSDKQQYQGPYSYNYEKYGSAYTTPYEGPHNGAEYTKYGPYYNSYSQNYPSYEPHYRQGYAPYYNGRHGGEQTEGSYKYQKHGYGNKNQYSYDERSLSEIAQYIAYAKELSYERRGEILLQSIQELAARFNIERIVDAVEHKTDKQQQYYQAEREKIAQLMQLMRTLIEQVREERSISEGSEATLNIIADIMNGRLILKQQQFSSAVQSTLQALQQEIVNILGSDVGAVREVTPLALSFGNLREPLTQQIIIAYAHLIADYRQQLQPYGKDQLSGDIEVQSVRITPLITYTENYDADLINLLDEKLLQSNTYNLQQLSQKVVARQQRLNYEPFTISLDIAVEQPQEVAIRVLLVPQIGVSGRRASLTEYPQNHIVIDTFVERLEAGKNYIQRSSRQFNGYNNDATTISQLYYQVMTGQILSEAQYQPSSIRQLPRNLLLPRGANVDGGLPVQILVIATPVTQQNRQYLSEALYPEQISGFGIAAVGADQLPLGYPLDRQIYNEECLYVPNIKVIETTIQYDDVQSRVVVQVFKRSPIKMKWCLLTLMCLIGMVAAGVLDKIDEELSIVGQERDSESNGRSGTQHISQMSHEDLMHQKLLLDIVQHINAPIENEQLLQISNAAQNQLIDDEDLYNEGIDEEMAHVIQLSRNQKLLSKNEPFTLANEEHMRQMIGLYRLLACARDWETLQKNIIHARTHINDALFVNALLPAIRDRKDTQTLILPGIHEILPELYLDEELIEHAKNINLNQLDDAQAKMNTGLHIPTILEMIGMNKLLRSKNSKNVSSLDDRELWMPWREMRLEIQSRKAGKAPMHVSLTADDRIVISDTKSQGEDGDEGGLQLLTEDVGFQAYLQSFMADLCLNEKDSKQMSGQQQNRDELARVGLRKNVVPTSPTEMRYYDQQSGDDDTWNTDTARRRWTPVKHDVNANGEHDTWMTNEEHMNRDKNVAQIRRVGLNRNVGSMLKSSLRNHYGQIEDTDMNIDAVKERSLPIARRQWAQGNQYQSGAGFGHVSLNRNEGAMVHSGTRNQIGKAAKEGVWNKQDIWNKQNLDSDAENDAAMKGGQQIWSQWNPYTNSDEHVPTSGHYNYGLEDDTSNLQWLERNAPRNYYEMHQRNGFDGNSMRSSQLLGGGLPTHTADDENLLYRSQLRQHAAVMNDKLYTHSGRDVVSDWTHESHDSDEANTHKRFMNPIQSQGGALPEGHEAAGMHESWTNRMQMDWNRQMAMHRQKSKAVDEHQGGYTGEDEVEHNLREVNIDDERLLPISRRKISNINWSKQQDEPQQRDDQYTGSRGSQRWAHDSLMETAQGKNKKGMSFISNDGAWTVKTERGMGNIGVHEAHEVSRNNVLTRTDDMERWTMKNRGSQKTHSTDETQKGAQWEDETDKNGPELGSQHAQGARVGLGNLRHKRSLRNWSSSTNADHERSIEQMRGGELLLHNLQQLVARINLEQISHGHSGDELESQYDVDTARRGNSLQGISTDEANLKTDQNRGLRENINEVEKHFKSIIRAEVEQKIGTTQKQTLRNQAEIDNVIGDALLGKNREHENALNIVSILRAIIKQTEDAQSDAQKLTQTSLNVKNPAILHVLRRIVHIGDAQRQQNVDEYRKEDIQAEGITINQVQVDKLCTYVEPTDVDLINALDATQTIKHTADGPTRMIVARQQRLNHKEFTIKLDVTAVHNQRVVVRTLLGPKIEGSSDKIIAQLNDQRHNYILLDAHIVQLHSGRNQLKRKSRDITWTAADTTPFTEIYKRVIRALKGAEVEITVDEVRGQTCRFPHRLLLPRGREDGLPMQMLVVITPVVDEDRSVQKWSLDQRVCGIGVGSANLDLLPLGFPMDRSVNSASELLSASNVHLMDVKIYHDKQVKVHDWST
ncbi:uncharacterized protein Fbp1 [Eurosta solidaginis]|uniref:uncharacterized protein Fbp1 n=1 Tax=Eurosta solidaginis TaxID=178769 RepID=UPI0035314884